MRGRNWTNAFFNVFDRDVIAVPNGSFSYIVTDAKTYIEINGPTTVAGGRCRFERDVENSTVPFFNDIGLGTFSFNASKVIQRDIDESFDLYFNTFDLGISPLLDFAENQSTPTGMHWFYETVDNTLQPINGTGRHFAANCFEGSPFEQCQGVADEGNPNILTSLSMIVECQSIGINAQLFNGFNTLNTPTGVFQMCSYNPQDANGTIRIDGAFAVPKSIPSNGLRNITISLAQFNNLTNLISNVRVVPEQPQGQQNVTIRFDSTFPTNGTVFYKSVGLPVNQTQLDNALFASAFQNLTTTSHAVEINGSEIFNGLFYQFFVISGDTIDNNSDNFYNFSVGAAETFEANDTAIVPKGIEDVSDIIGVPFGDVTFAFGMVLLLGSTVLSIMAGGMKLGLSVFGSELVIFTLIGILPQFLVIPIIAITALGIALFIKKVMG